MNSLALGIGKLIINLFTIIIGGYLGIRLYYLVQYIKFRIELKKEMKKYLQNK